MTPEAIRGRSMGGYAEDGAARQPFVENLIDFRHSVVQANKRSDAGDATLEICPRCMCEVDVSPQPHRPGCLGIGKARATTSPVLATLEPFRRVPPTSPPPVVASSSHNGLDALERMDAGLPQEPELEADVDEPDAVLEERDDADGDAGDLLAAPRPAVQGRAIPAAEGDRSAASRSSSTRRTWTRQDIIAALQAHVAEHGHPPTSKDWSHVSPDHPSATIVKQQFPSWADAVEAAGFDRPRRGASKKPRAARAPVANLGLNDKPADTATARGEEASDEKVTAATGGEAPTEAPASPTANLSAVRAAALRAVNAIFDLLEHLEQDA